MKRVFISQGWKKRGAEVALKNLLLGLQDLENCTLLNLGEKKFDIPNLKEINIPLYGVSRIFGVFRLFKYIVYRVNRNTTFYYVNGKIFDFSLLIFLLQIFNFPIKLVVWEHCIPEKHWTERNKFISKIIEHTYMYILNYSTKIFVPSAIIAHTIPEFVDKIKIINNPLRISLDGGYNEEVNALIDSQKINIVFVGAISHEKRPDLFVNIIKELYKKDNRVVGHIFGDGPLKDSILLDINARGFQSVIKIHNWTPHIHKIINRSECLLVTSEFETFCNVIAEAIFLGCPVFTTQWYGVKDIYGNQIDYLSDSILQNVDSIISKIYSRKFCIVENEQYLLNINEYISNEF